MAITAYLNHKDLGSGERVFLILSQREGYTTLYYPPTLEKIRLTQGEWERLPAQPILIDRCAMAARIEDRARVYRKYNLRFSEVTMDRALEVLGC